METISDPRKVKARKTHKCNWCNGTISIGEIYNTATYKYDVIYQWKSHNKCMELVGMLNMEGDEGISDEIFYEYVNEKFDDIHRELDEDHYESSDFETPDISEQVVFVYNHLTSKIKL